MAMYAVFITKCSVKIHVEINQKMYLGDRSEILKFHTFLWRQVAIDSIQ